MRKNKNLVPMALDVINPYLWLAATLAPNQQAADRMIRTAMPRWLGEVPSRTGIYKEDVQAAGSYSLRLSGGMGR